MTPGARAAAAIDLLQTIDDDLARPADALVAAWFRQHRYAGGGDRRAISALVYSVLRRRAQIDWWLEQAACGADPRSRTIAAGVLGQGWDEAELDSAFDGGQYRPAPLNEQERAMAAVLSGKGFDDPAQPLHVRGNIPAWMEDKFCISLGNAVEDELAALLQEAPVDLRVNRLKSDREAVANMLARDGIDSQPTPFSPYGLRLAGRTNLAASRILRDGLAEPQDESSQIAALLTDARPGQTVVDYCAGAGGKTLALAAMMENRGQIFAHDAERQRLAPIFERIKRAGCRNVQVIAEVEGLKNLEGRADLVLVDAPCTGSGIWRRRPDAKWRLSEAQLETRMREQADVLESAAAFVKPGGRLVYVTCSVFMQENDAQIERFVGENPAFAPVGHGALWTETVTDGAGKCRTGKTGITLSPRLTDTDGFFISVMRRN